MVSPKFPVVFPPQVPRIYYEARTCFTEQDVAYIQVIFNTNMTEFMVENSYHMFHGDFLITLAASGQGEIFSQRNLTKKNVKWKSKCETTICEGLLFRERC